jgi:hypothetical protein
MVIASNDSPQTQNTLTKPPFLLDTPVWTLRNQEIRKVYYRKRKGMRSKALGKQPIFTQSSMELDLPQNSGSGIKRKLS